MRKVEIWIAEDGTRFEGLDACRECREYEESYNEEKYKVLSSFIKFYYCSGKPVFYHRMVRGATPMYAKVIRVPNEDDSFEINELWEKVVPEGLYDELYSDDSGWYISPDENDRWQKWEEYEQTYKNHKEKIEKAENEG